MGLWHMARNDINLDLISARLAGMNKPYVEEPDSGDEPPSGGDDGGDSGKTMNAGFIATVIVLFMTVFGGTYFFSDGIDFSKIASINWGWKKEAPKLFLTSSVDEECKLNDWVTSTQNNNIMHCYLTNSTGRLCSPNERQALVAMIERFQDDHDSFDRDMNLAAMGMAVNTPLSDKMQLGLEAAKADNAKSPVEALKHEKNAMDLANGMMAGPNAVLARQKHVDWPLGTLQESLTKLGQKGLITLNDFSYSRPDWVTAALQDVQVTSPSCK